VLGFVLVLVFWLLVFTVRDKVRAESRLARLAATDALTGLGNRRTLDVQLDEEWRRARRSGSTLSVLFIDIDHFKRFNDTHGHAAGDQVLAAVAGCIASVVRRSIDLVARYGGEEFAVLLPGTSSAGALRTGEKIRAQTEALRFDDLPLGPATVTISVGCATCVPKDGGNGPELIAAADAQLYAAKSGGRNQVKAVDWSHPLRGPDDGA
jgi:diguanylate cyclase (GGDEF)-like protein